MKLFIENRSILQVINFELFSWLLLYTGIVCNCAVWGVSKLILSSADHHCTAEAWYPLASIGIQNRTKSKRQSSTNFADISSTTLCFCPHKGEMSAPAKDWDSLQCGFLWLAGFYRCSALPRRSCRQDWTDEDDCEVTTAWISCCFAVSCVQLFWLGECPT